MIERGSLYSLLLILVFLIGITSASELPLSAFSVVSSDQMSVVPDQTINDTLVVEFEGVEIRWLGCAGFQYKKGDFIVYVDPYQLPAGLEKADVIYCTHDHVDHFSRYNIEKVCSEENTTLITAVGPLNSNTISRIRAKERITVRPYSNITRGNVTFEAVPAYNHLPGRNLHPRDSNYTGVIIDFGGIRIYQTGDTDYIPEMKDFVVDIVVLPVINNEWVMSPSEAARAVEYLNTKSILQAAIPMHYDTNTPFGYTGPVDRAYEFADAADTRVIIMNKYPGSGDTYTLSRIGAPFTSSSTASTSQATSSPSSQNLEPSTEPTSGFGWFIGIIALGTSILILPCLRLENKKSR